MSDDPIERFAEAIVARFGLRFDETRSGFLAEVLEKRVGARPQDVEGWLQRFEAGETSAQELGELATDLTVGETYFFRNHEQFAALDEVVLPARMAARSRSRTLRMLSAGCASGEEPYTIAILLRERVVSRGEGWTIDIAGIDLNPAHLRRAALARYSPWSLRETPADKRLRWFRSEGSEHVLDPQVKAMVRFAERNLADEDATLWQPEVYDAIFCRNVLMYFAPERASEVVARFERSLAPGGYLFLGSAESLRGLSHGFQLHHSHGTFYYERKTDGHDAPVHGVHHREHPSDDGAPLVALVDAADSWVTAIRDASARIRELVEERAPSPAVAEPDDTAPRMASALELLRQERYGEALASLDGIAGAAARGAEVLLLRAVLLTHGGQLQPAREVCTSLLALDGLDVGAHYLLALCAERAGELDRAIEHGEAAAYLDPGFAMPRLHLGLMARRRGDRERARHELARALTLLEREDPARLLLFGGGFGRDTLVTLCRAELVASGGGR